MTLTSGKRESEVLAKFDENVEHKKLKSANAEPYSTRKRGACTAGQNGRHRWARLAQNVAEGEKMLLRARRAKTDDNKTSTTTN